jgi:hypothetical protein
MVMHCGMPQLGTLPLHLTMAQEFRLGAHLQKVNLVRHRQELVLLVLQYFLARLQPARSR